MVNDFKSENIDSKLVSTPNCRSEESSFTAHKFRKNGNLSTQSLIYTLFMTFKLDTILLTLLSVISSFLYVYSDQENSNFIDCLNEDSIDLQLAEFHLISSVFTRFFAVYLTSQITIYNGKFCGKIRSGLLTIILEKQLEFEAFTTTKHKPGTIANYI